MGDRFLTEDEKKLWEAVNKETKPLKRTHKKIVINPPKQKIESSSEPFASLFDAFSSSPSLSSSTNPEIQSLDRKTKRKIRTSAIKIEKRLDLHGQTQNQAYDRLVNFIENSARNHLKLVLVITGKGRSKEEVTWSETPYGVLREKVPQWLMNKKVFPSVRSVSVANPQDGGNGALYVFLKG